MTVTDGSACMGEDKSRKQTEQAALLDAKKKAAEFALTQIKSQTHVRNLELEKEIVSAYSNAEVRVIQETMKGWYKDPLYGDCYHVGIRAEVIPTTTEENKANSAQDKKESEGKWVLWMKATTFRDFNEWYRSGGNVSKVSWDILTVHGNKEDCGKAYDLAKKYFTDTEGQLYHEFYCLPETIDPREKR